jgi:molybdate transport system substrate-binding protein
VRLARYNLRVPTVLFVLAAFAAACAGGGRAPAPPLVVLAAASMKGALDEIAAAHTHDTGTRVSIVYAATSALARQVASGAPGDVFLSADEEWMDDLAAAGHLRAGPRRVVIGNRLVLVAPAGRSAPFALAPGTDLAGRFGTGRLAVADPVAVPAGRYARDALVWLGAWPGVKDRLAPAENVRAALLLVALGEAPLGIVYASDAAAEVRVVVLATFPTGAHAPIRYPGAVLARSRHPQAHAFLDRLTAPAAREVFLRHGFTWPE